jgi:hypothetical protein
MGRAAQICAASIAPIGAFKGVAQMLQLKQLKTAEYEPLDTN